MPPEKQWDITRRFVTAAAQRFEVTVRLAEMRPLPEQDAEEGEGGVEPPPDLGEAPGLVETRAGEEETRAPKEGMAARDEVGVGET